MTDLDRRTVLAAGAALTLAPQAAAAKAAPLTAAAVVDAIKAHVGVPWLDKTVDGIVAGDGATPVTGIATTMMATLAVLKRAAAAKLNLIVTHEPTFWSHQEDVSALKDDPLYREKLAFIKDNKLVTFHFHDHFHMLKPRDGIAEGMMRRLGWSTYADPANPQRFTIPETTVGALTRLMQDKLKASTIRTIGNPDTKVTKVVSSWGYAQKPAGVAVFNDPAGIEVFVIGECWEWELQEYTADLVAAGRNKALIMVGHIQSEQWGMDYCAEWLRGFVKTVPVQFLEMPEPYWSPS
jgi:putative NIF3 family GTP cyclohydrolase 1 type 2